MVDPLPLEFRRAALEHRFLPLAIERTRTSLEMAKELHTAGVRSPAFVWAVRSGEIFFREALLFPIEFEATATSRRPSPKSESSSEPGSGPLRSGESERPTASRTLCTTR